MPYLKSSILKFLGSTPIAFIKVTISFDDIILDNVLFCNSFSKPFFLEDPFNSTYVFNILPLNGKTAWFSRFLPCFAEPPAESPSTINNSVPSDFPIWQSANLPGNPVNSKAPFLLTFSLAFLATSLATAAWIAFCKIILTILGFWSNHTDNFSFIIDSTINLISEDTNLSFVCDENLGSGILIDKTEVNPSLASSPLKVTLLFFNKLFSVAYLFITLVNALLKPSKCVPPSFWYILLVKAITSSLYPAFHLIEHSTITLFFSPTIDIGFLNKSLSLLFNNFSFFWSKNSTNSSIPPSYLFINSFGFECVLSNIDIFIPLFRKANSLILFCIIVALNFVTEKISLDGKKLILVPEFLVFPIIFNGEIDLPFLNSI